MFVISLEAVAASLVQQLRDFRAKVSVILLTFCLLSPVSKYEVCIPSMKREQMEKPESTASVAGRQKCFQKSYTSVLRIMGQKSITWPPLGTGEIWKCMDFFFFSARHIAALTKPSEYNRMEKGDRVSSENILPQYCSFPEFGMNNSQDFLLNSSSFITSSTKLLQK